MERQTLSLSLTRTHCKYNIYHSDVINRFRKKANFDFIFLFFFFSSIVILCASSYVDASLFWQSGQITQNGIVRACACALMLSRAPLTNFINKNDVKRFNLVIHLVKLLFTVSYSHFLAVLPSLRLSFNFLLIFSAVPICLRSTCLY